MPQLGLIVPTRRLCKGKVSYSESVNTSSLGKDCYRMHLASAVLEGVLNYYYYDYTNCRLICYCTLVHRPKSSALSIAAWVSSAYAHNVVDESHDSKIGQHGSIMQRLPCHRGFAVLLEPLQEGMLLICVPVCCNHGFSQKLLQPTQLSAVLGLICITSS